MGEATAIQLLRRFGSLDEVLDRSAEVGGRLAFNLSEQDSAHLDQTGRRLPEHHQW